MPFLRNDYGLREAAADTAAPTSGTWNTFDFVENSAPAVGTPIGWLCTSGGTSGTWVPVGPLQSTTVTANSAAANVAVTAGIVSITGSGGYALSLAAPVAANVNTEILFVNASSGTITLVAQTGTAIIGLATMVLNTQGRVRANSTNWYRT